MYTYTVSAQLKVYSTTTSFYGRQPCDKTQENPTRSSFTAPTKKVHPTTLPNSLHLQGGHPLQLQGRYTRMTLFHASTRRSKTIRDKNPKQGQHLERQHTKDSYPQNQHFKKLFLKKKKRKKRPHLFVQKHGRNTNTVPCTHDDDCFLSDA